MKKRLNWLLSAVFVGALCLSATPGFAECDEQGNSLTAGQDIAAGNVYVWNDAEFLYVEYQTSGDWSLNEVHLHISTAPFDRRLPPGQTPYKEGDLNADSYLFVIPLDLLIAGDSCDQTLYLQAHASVETPIEVDGEWVLVSETAYGGNIEKPKRGAWYGEIAYTICCDFPLDDPEPICQEETAWAAGTRYVTQGSWATYTPYDGTEQTFTLFAGQSYMAGTVHFSAAVNGEVTITITLVDGWEFNDSKSATVQIQGYDSAPSGNPAPGQFENQFSPSGDSFSESFDSYAFYGIHVNVRNCD